MKYLCPHAMHDELVSGVSLRNFSDMWCTDTSKYLAFAASFVKGH